MGMISVPDDAGTVPPVISQPTPGPSGVDVLDAAMRQSNSVVSVLQGLRSEGSFGPVEGYSAWDDIKDKPQYLAHATSFAGFHSPAETKLMMGKIDQEEADQRTLSSAGALGVIASMGAGALDPTMLLPGRVAISVLKDGAPFVRGALEVGGAMAAQSALQETALQASQETRPFGESVMSVGSATILGALLGSAAAWLSPAEHANVVRNLDRQRAEADAHVQGTPPPPDLATTAAQASLRDQLIAAGRPHDEADQVAAVAAARYATRAERLGRPGDADALAQGIEIAPGGEATEGRSFEQPNFRAYHGTPHDFDRFDISRISSGEGVQAFGHGLYFAESEGVAGSYRDALSNTKLSAKTFDGEPFNKTNPAHIAAWYAYATPSRDAALSELAGMKDFGPEYQKAHDLLMSGTALPTISSPGRLYTVRIKPDSDHFLDWDKPLRKQNPKVRKILQKVWFPDGLDGIDQRTSVGAFYDSRKAARGAAEASRELAEAGIPGIKYLDQRSRDKGDGTRNFVVFDDRDVEVTHKDGTPVTAAEKTEAIEAHQQEQAPKQFEQRGAIPREEGGPGGHPRSFFQFAGERAATADHGALAEAKRLDAAGTKPEDIWQNTGWYKRPDGWRFEIDDSKTSFKKGALKERPARFSGKAEYGFNGKLGELIDAPEVFKAYPDLAGVDVSIRDIASFTASGGFDPKARRIEVATSSDKDHILSVLLHEIQHAVQLHEGFEPGGNASTLQARTEVALYDLTHQIAALRPGSNVRAELETLRTKLREQVERMNGGVSGFSVTSAQIDTYRRLLGEVEARNTEFRQKMTAAQRRANFPRTTEDVPADEQYAGQGLVEAKPKNDSLIDRVVKQEFDVPDTIDRVDDYGERSVTRYHGISLAPLYGGEDNPKPITGGRSNIVPSMKFTPESISAKIKEYGATALLDHIKQHIAYRQARIDQGDVEQIRRLTAVNGMFERIIAKHPDLGPAPGYEVTPLDREGLIERYSGRAFTQDDFDAARDKVTAAIHEMGAKGELSEDETHLFGGDFEYQGFGGQHGADLSHPEAFAKFYAQHKDLVDEYNAALENLAYQGAKANAGLSMSMGFGRRAEERRQMLFQRGGPPGAGEPQGRVTFAGSRRIVELFKSANASTAMHEFGHIWLEEMIGDAAHPNAPQGIKDDMTAVLKWLGVEKPEDIGVKHHEQFARGFEQYLREGNAPSSALAGVFEKFKAWLTAIYRSVTELGTPISDEMRGVFDRMLATDEEIAARPTRGVGAAGSGLAAPAGAAATDTRVLEPVRTGIGLERVPFDPVARTLAQPSIAARRGVADLAEVATLVRENLEGRPTVLGGGPPLETILRLQQNQVGVKIRDLLADAWKEMRFGENVPVAAIARDRLGRFGGLPDRGAAPTFEQFKKLVGDAMMDDDRHAVAQVQRAAADIRALTFDQWSPRAEKAVEGFKRAEQKPGEGYFPHLWNKIKIQARRPEFVNKLTAWYMSDQAAKRAAQGRLQAYQNSLAQFEGSIRKLTGRLERKQADLEEDEALRDEVSRLNAFAFQRATSLRESEFQNVGGVAVPVPGKNIEKARGGAVFESRIRERGNTLADRASAHAAEVEEIETRLQAAHASVAEMRGKIEDELGRWEGKSAAEAKSALADREKYEAEREARRTEGEAKKGRTRSADEAVDRAVKRILASDRDKPVEDMRARANETVDRILSSPDGRLAYDESAGVPDFGPQVPGSPARGSLAERALDVSNDWARDWIERDVEQVAKTYMRTFVPDVLLAERFGDVEMSNVFRQINEEYAGMVDAAKTERDRTKLGKLRDRTIEDVAALRDRFRGLYNIPQTGVAKRLGRVSAAVRNANIPLSLGMAAVNSFGDAAGVVFRWGLGSAFRDAWAPFVKSVMTDRKLTTEALRQFRAMGIAIDTATAQRSHEFAGLSEPYHPGSPFERSLQWGADKFQLANLLGPWTDIAKTITSTVAAQELFRAAEAASKGTATKKQLRALGEANIDGNLASRIAEQYAKSGNVIDGIRLPNTEAWTDQSARLAFEGALSREANIAVVTPGIDKPLFLSDPVFAVLAQFKSFTAAATTRILIANLQRADAETLQGLVASMALGMISYKINALTGGTPTSDRPQDWIKEAMSRGNVLGWLEEGNALTSKMTRGRVDLYRAIGSDKPLSRYAGRTVLDQLIGPTFGKIESIAKITGATASGDWKAEDVKAVRRLTAGQNLFYLRGLFNQVEVGADNAFGIPQQAVH